MLLEVLNASLSAMGVSGIIIGAGLLLFRRGLLGPAMRTYLSRICYVLLTPCLLLSTTSGYDAASVQRWAILPLLCCTHIALGAVLGHCLGRLSGVPCEDHTIVVLCSMFHNVGNIPTLILTAVISTSSLFEGEGTLQRGLSQMFFYGLPWQFLIYSIGTSAVKGHQEPPTPVEPSDTDCPSDTTQDQLDGFKRLPHSESGVSLSSLVSNDSDYKETELDLVALEVDDDLTNTPSTVPEVQAVVAPKEGCRESVNRSLTRLERLCREEPLQAQAAAMAIGCITPLRWLFVGASAPLNFVTLGVGMLGAAAVPCQCLVLGANLAIAAGFSEVDVVKVDEPASLWPSRRTVGVICFVKLLVLPLVSIPATVMLLRSGVVGDVTQMEPAFVFNALAWSCLPSAQSLCMLFQMEGHHTVTARLSSVYLIQYAISALTTTGWVTVVLSLVSWLCGKP